MVQAVRGNPIIYHAMLIILLWFGIVFAKSPSQSPTKRANPTFSPTTISGYIVETTFYTSQACSSSVPPSVNGILLGACLPSSNNKTYYTWTSTGVASAGYIDVLEIYFNDDSCSNFNGTTVSLSLPTSCTPSSQNSIQYQYSKSAPTATSGFEEA